MADHMADLRTIEFKGVTFALREKVSEYRLTKFARAVARGESGDETQTLAAVLDLVEACIAPKNIVDESGQVTAFGWGRFDALCDETEASVEDLVGVISSMFQGAAERPTGRSADSSVGPTVIEPKSEPKPDDSTSLFAGRPDLQLVIRAQKAAEAVAV